MRPELLELFELFFSLESELEDDLDRVELLLDDRCRVDEREPLLARGSDRLPLDEPRYCWLEDPRSPVSRGGSKCRPPSDDRPL